MKWIAVITAAIMMIGSVGCGSNTKVATTGTVAVSLSPTVASVLLGKTQQFTPTVTGTTNTTVSWKVNDVVGGNSTLGTINSSGLYTAPTAVPSTNPVTVTAISAADSSKTAIATVTIQPPIAVTPATATVAATQTQQFTATVNFNTKDTTVTWQVNGTTGGNSTVGTIDTNGLYTAPNAIPNPRTVTVTAISKADTSQKADAVVTITAPPIVIAPASPTIAAGSQQVFTATAGGNAIKPIWAVSCQSQVTGACGTIASDGTFTAPAAPPPGGTVTILASVTDNSAAPSNTTATIQFANVTLNGAYAFGFTSRAGNNYNPEAGSIIFDGNGKVTGGSIDRGNSAVAAAITGGAYNVGSDGRGFVQVTTTTISEYWQIVVVNNTFAQMVLLDGNKIALTGSLEQQKVTTAFSALQGNYTLTGEGVTGGTTASPFAMAAGISSDGAGNVTRGFADINKNGAASTNLAVTGSYTAPNSAGRGTLVIQTTFGAQTFAYYQVDTTKAKIVEIDGAQRTGGDLVKQPAGPFANGSFNGKFAFTMSGSKSAAMYAIGGVFAMNGSGTVGSLVVDGANQVAFNNSGAYSVTDSVSGRTTVTWSLSGVTQQYVFYPRGDGGFATIEVDGTVARGIALPQTLTTPSVISLIGNFALQLGGLELGTSGGQEVASGVLTLTGSVTFTGTVDVVNVSGSNPGLLMQAGAFSVDIATGRGVASTISASPALPNASFIFYLLDNSHALVLVNDSSRVLTGSLVKQF